MAITFAKLKEVPVEGNETAVVREPTTGLVTAFLNILDEAKDSEGNFPTGMFLGLRSLVTLFDNGQFFLGSLVNYLNEVDGETWEYSVSPEDSPRQILEALSAEYVLRVVEYYTDQIPHSQTIKLNEAIDKVWPSKESKGNE